MHASHYCCYFKDLWGNLVEDGFIDEFYNNYKMSLVILYIGKQIIGNNENDVVHF
jgi:hypothetical protein